MKELGSRFDEHYRWTRIVELTDVEFLALEKLIESRDLNAEYAVRRERVERLRDCMRGLQVSTRVFGVLYSNAWDLSDNNVSFGEWAQIVLDGYKEHGVKGHSYEPLSSLRNFGEKSYLELVKALESRYA